MTLEIAFITHILLTTALAWIWFKSDFPVYLTKWLRRWKILRKKDDWWPDPATYETWLRHEWEAWVMIKDPELAHLLMCPTCFSTRVSLAAALWTVFFTGQWLVLPFCIIAVPITCTWLKLTK